MRRLEPAASPRVSVVIPCRDEAPRLATCLDALAGQTFARGAYEAIVVDGHSRDGSRDVARDAGATVVDEPPRGPGAARNAGIRAARAPIIAFTDADCVPAPDWLEALVALFEARADVGGVGGSLSMPRSTLQGLLDDLDNLASYRGAITSNAAYRRAVLDEVGGFDEALRCGEDWDLAWRVQDAGHRVVHDPRPHVLHDCPEANGRARAYLSKQFWYARHDVRTIARGLRRAAAAPASRPGSRMALRWAGSAAPGALAAASLMGGVVAGRAAWSAAGLAWLFAQAARTQAGARRALAGPMPAAGRLFALRVAKDLTRGAGTLVGVYDLAAAPLRRRARGGGRGARAPWPS